MSSVEKPLNKNFFLGMLTIVLDLKISLVENYCDRMGELYKLFDSSLSHLDLIKELSTVFYFDFILISSAINFKAGFAQNLLEDFLNSFKYYKTYRKFRKG